ncbi:hypothetical protein, partial [Paraburkholderia solisilvae]
LERVLCSLCLACHRSSPCLSLPVQQGIRFSGASSDVYERKLKIALGMVANQAHATTPRGFADVRSSTSQQSH